MSNVEIPLRSDLPSFKFNIELDAEFFTFQFNWNVRSGRWYFDILTQDETPILMGQPCLVTYDGLARFKDVRLPKGDLFFFDSSGQNLDPGREELGQRVFLYYVESDE